MVDSPGDMTTMNSRRYSVTLFLLKCCQNTILPLSSVVCIVAAMSEANHEKGCDEGVRIIAVVTENVRLVRSTNARCFCN